MNNKQGDDMLASERIEFFNHTISLCADHLHDVVVVHYENRWIYRATYPHNSDRFTKLNEAQMFVWNRYLKAQRVELEHAHKKTFE